MCCVRTALLPLLLALALLGCGEPARVRTPAAPADTAPQADAQRADTAKRSAASHVQRAQVAPPELSVPQGLDPTQRRYALIDVATRLRASASDSSEGLPFHLLRDPRTGQRRTLPVTVRVIQQQAGFTQIQSIPQERGELSYHCHGGHPGLGPIALTAFVRTGELRTVTTPNYRDQVWAHNQSDPPTRDSRGGKGGPPDGSHLPEAAGQASSRQARNHLHSGQEFPTRTLQHRPQERSPEGTAATE